MSFLRTTFRFLLSATGTVLFILALFTIVLAIKTSDSDLEIRQESSSQDDSTVCRFHFSRGGLWIMYLRQSPNESLRFLSNVFPISWHIAWSDPNWQDRLTPGQAGPNYLGFHTKSSQFQRQYSDFGLITDRASDETVTATGRLTRVPLLAIVAALLALPVLQFVKSVRRYRAKPPAKRDKLASLALGRLFGIVTAISTVCLSLALWQLVRSQPADFCAGWSSRWGVRPPFMDSESLGRELLITSKGLQFRRVFHVVGDARVGAGARYEMWAGFPLLAPRLEPSTFLGFAFSREDVTRSPVGFDATRHVGWTVLVPHWALVLTFGILPALWLKHTSSLRLRAARLRLGQCLTCGYDLRASPHRCPECGAQAVVK